MRAACRDLSSTGLILTSRFHRSHEVRVGFSDWLDARDGNSNLRSGSLRTRRSLVLDAEPFPADSWDRRVPPD